jgi:hypothetical protein
VDINFNLLNLDFSPGCVMHNFNGVKYCKIVEEKRNFLECVKVYVGYQQHNDRFFDLPASGVRLSPRTGKGKIKIFRQKL